MRTVIRTLIKAGVPTPAGRVYSQEMLKNICSMPFPEFGAIGIDITDEMRIDQISHRNLSLLIDDEDYLSVEIETLGTPMGETIERWIKDSGESKAFINICFTVKSINDPREIVEISGLPIEAYT